MLVTHVRQYLLTIITVLLVLVCSTDVIATETNWQFLMRASDSAGTGHGSNFTAGTKSTTLDTKDTSDVAGSFLSTGVANVMSYNPGYGGNPPLYTADYRAPRTGARLHVVWDIRVWRMPDMTGNTLKLVWWAGATSPVNNDPPASFGGVSSWPYTIEVYDDPTGQNQGFMWSSSDPTGGSSSNPLGALIWTNLADNQVKGDQFYAPDGGIKIRFGIILPEPSSLLALAGGLGALAGMIRRRR